MIFGITYIILAALLLHLFALKMSTSDKILSLRHEAELLLRRARTARLCAEMLANLGQHREAGRQNAKAVVLGIEASKKVDAAEALVNNYFRN